MATEEELAEIFCVLRPKCLQLVQHPTVELLKDLQYTLSKVNVLALDGLQDYVLFPFIGNLKNLKPGSDNFKIEFFRCLNVLLMRIREISEVMTFNELVNSVIRSICPPLPESHDNQSQDSSQNETVCEEVKLEGVQTLDHLFAKASHIVLFEFYHSSPSIPVLGHAASVLLGFVEKERLRSLKIASLRALLRMSFCCVEQPQRVQRSAYESGKPENAKAREIQEPKEKCCHKHQAVEQNSSNSSGLKSLECITGMIFDLFLPGISMGLVKVALKDEKQGQSITAYCIAALARILERTFSDDFLASAKGKRFPLKPEYGDYKKLLVERDDSWTDSTSKRLCFLVEKLVDMPTDDRWRVRLEMMRMAEVLLTNCSKSLSNCSKKLLDVLVLGLIDDEPIVRQQANQIIQSMKTKIKTGSDQDFIDLTEDNLFKLIADLPSMLNSPNDETKLLGLRLLLGHLEMLRERSSSLTSSFNHVDQLLSSLSRLLEFDCSSLLITDDNTNDVQIYRRDVVHLRQTPSYSFKKFKDDRILVEAIKILNVIGRFCDLQVLVDQTLETMMTCDKFKKQSAFCLTHILNGASSSDNQSRDSANFNRKFDWSQIEHIVDCIHQQVLDKKLWTRTCEPSKVSVRVQPKKSNGDFASKLLFVEPGDDSFACSSLLPAARNSGRQMRGPNPREMKEETTFACLLLDVVGATAILAGPNFEPKLARTLLPVLERMGSARSEVRLRARTTLFNMSWATSRRRRSGSSSTGSSEVETSATSEGILEGDSTTEMLIRCSDYLMSSIIPCLGSLARHSDVLLALRAVVELGTPKPFWPSDSTATRSTDFDLASHKNMIRIIHSSFKQIMTSFDNHYSDFALEFWKLLLRITILISRTVELEQFLEKSSSGSAHLQNNLPVDKMPRPSAASTVNKSDTSFGSSPRRLRSSTCVSLTVNDAENTDRPVAGRRSDGRMSLSQEKKRDTRTSRVELHSKMLVEFVLELEHNRKIVESISDDDDDDDDSDGKNIFERMQDDLKSKKSEDDEELLEDAADKKVEVPFYVTMLEQIMERCQNFLVSPHTQLRLVVLEVTSTACPLLKPHQEVLLPLIHNIWSPFHKRFSDPEHFVCTKAFETLRVMADSSGGFVRRKVLVDVVPRVVALLESSAKNSHRAGRSYKFSSSCQLQKCILENLGELCRLADVSGQPLHNMIAACIPYLSVLQPKCLYEACLKTFQQFISIEPDAVWLLLTEVYCPSKILTPPPDARLKPIHLAGASERNEFTDNVMVLYKLLEFHGEH